MQISPGRPGQHASPGIMFRDHQSIIDSIYIKLQKTKKKADFHTTVFVFIYICDSIIIIRENNRQIMTRENHGTTHDDIVTKRVSERKEKEYV